METRKLPLGSGEKETTDDFQMGKASLVWMNTSVATETIHGRQEKSVNSQLRKVTEISTQLRSS